eukprot:Skav230794  [mRNA]  locus=scaffold312:114320:115495:+ [translate_table: standard]
MPPRIRRPAAAKAKALAKAAARVRPPRPGRGLARRRPSAEVEETPKSGSEVEKQFNDGHFVEADQLPLQCLTEGLEVIVEGYYWSRACSVAGQVRGVVIKKAKDSELKMKLQGTDNEDLVTWGSQPGVSELKVHLCGSQCPRNTDAHGFMHALKVRLKKEDDRGGWCENLQESVDEMARLRRLQEEEEEKQRKKKREEEEESEDESSDQKKKKGKEKKKKEKEGKDSKEKAKKSKKKKKKEGKKKKVDAQKTLVSCYKDTGLDPDPKVRARIRKSVKKKLKRKKDLGSSGEGSSSSSSASSTDEGSVGEQVFEEEHKVRAVARHGPGILATATIRAMQEHLLTDQGTMWSAEQKEVPPICLQYFRSTLQKKLAGGALREALTISWSLDLLL